MKRLGGFAVVFSVLLVFAGQRSARAQACQDEETMFKTALKDVSDLVDAVKKESVSDFQNHYHQKSYLSKSGFLLSMVGGVVDCLEKAAQDTAATKDQADGYKSKVDAYGKLKSKVEQQKNAVKSADDKNAKTLIEKSNLTT
jgi:hypothetical protein